MPRAKFKMQGLEERGLVFWALQGRFPGLHGGSRHYGGQALTLIGEQRYSVLQARVPSDQSTVLLLYILWLKFSRPL